jgi:hypothetical protein
LGEVKVPDEEDANSLIPPQIIRKDNLNPLALTELLRAMDVDVVSEIIGASGTLLPQVLSNSSFDEKNPSVIVRLACVQLMDIGRDKSSRVISIEWSGLLLM